MMILHMWHYSLIFAILGDRRKVSLRGLKGRRLKCPHERKIAKMIKVHKFRQQQLKARELFCC